MAQTKAYPAGPVPITLTGDVPQFRFVGFDGAVVASGKAIYGAYQDIDALTGDTVTIYTSGVLAIEAGGSFSAGGPVKLAAGGKVVAQGGTGDIIGYAVEDGADGNVVQILLARG